MRLTAVQRKRLAREARKLAMECVEGTAPEFGIGELWVKGSGPCCAMGHLCARAGARSSIGADHLYLGIPTERYLVTTANDAEDMDTLPWAFLALADALEAQP